MGYKIVAVNPLTNGVIRPFPLRSFGLANIASKDDAERKIRGRFNDMAEMRIAAVTHQNLGMGPVTRDEIIAEYKHAAYAEVGELEERWPMIEPALTAHLARQERRLDHFKRSCRIISCHDPRRAARKSGAQQFCGPHAGIRKVMKKSDYGKLSDFKMRVELTA